VHHKIQLIGKLLFFVMCFASCWCLLKHITLVLPIAVVDTRGQVVMRSWGPGFNFRHCNPSKFEQNFTKVRVLRCHIFLLCLMICGSTSLAFVHWVSFSWCSWVMW